MHSNDELRASWRLRSGMILAFLASMFLVLGACAVGPEPANELVTNQSLEAECSNRVILHGDPQGQEVLREIPQIDAYVVCASAEISVLSIVETDDERRWIPEPIEEPAVAGDEPSAQADPWRQWHHGKIKSEEAWRYSTGETVTVYVLDTAGNCGQMQMNCGENKNFVGGSSNDAHGHGSHVGSTIGELLNGQRGAGVAHRAVVSFYKVLGDNGSGSSSGIAAAMTDAADACPTPGKCIISMSLGSSRPSPTIERAATYAISQGVPVIAAGGNHGSSAPGYPGCSPGVIGIGATDSNDRIASFSARGTCIDLAGPGVSITASRPNGTPWTISGTSMATPNVSAVAALLLSLGAKPTDIETLLESTADNIGGQGLGAGRVNALAAVLSLGSPSPTDPPQPTPDKTEDSPGPVPATPRPTNAPAPPEEHEHCVGRGLVRQPDGSYVDGPVLIPCPDGGR